MSWCVPPWVSSAWDSVCFLDLVDYFLSHHWEAVSYYLFKYFLRSFLSFPSWTSLMWMLVHLMLSQRSLVLSSFLFILFYIFCSAAVISTCLSSRSFICSSVSIILLLIPSSVLFWRRQWHPTPVLLPGKSQGWRSLIGCSPCGHQESDTTEWLPFHFSLSCIGEGNGNPLQGSCLENPRDGGAWWAAVYGVAESQTRLKQLSSICINRDSLVAQTIKNSSAK